MMELRLSDLRNGESGTINSVGVGRWRGRGDGRRAEAGDSEKGSRIWV